MLSGNSPFKQVLEFLVIGANVIFQVHTTFDIFAVDIAISISLKALCLFINKVFLKSETRGR